MHIEVFIDGAARNNGIPDKKNDAACAVMIYRNRKEIVRFARGLGNQSNNEAEYEALIAALLICSMSDFAAPNIYSDSSVVVNQVNGIWKCRSPHLYPLWMTVKVIQEEYPFHLIQVPRSKVKGADLLCNAFLDTLEASRTKIKPADLYVPEL